MTKLFADLELKKQKMEKAEGEDRKRQREEDDLIVTKAKKDKEWKQEWEVYCKLHVVKGHQITLPNSRPLKSVGWTAGGTSRKAVARRNQNPLD